MLTRAHLVHSINQPRTTHHAEPVSSSIPSRAAIENTSLTADNSTNTTTEIEEAQATRYRTICGHFDDNLRHVIQGNHQEAFLAADQGFILVQELYYDLLSPADCFTSNTAGDRLLDLVRFCFSRASEVGNTDWPRWQNSVSGGWNRLSAAANVPPINWMAERGLNLVVDLDAVCGLFRHTHLSSPRLRAFAVRALNFLAEFSFDSTTRAVVGSSPRAHVAQWLSYDQVALRVMGLQIHNADPAVRGAALDALFDQTIRAAWYKRLTAPRAQ
jgi:hypothetical protein